MSKILHVGGTVVGSDHLYVGKTLVGRNNQDAWFADSWAGRFCAVVCDGCGSGQYSEFGARFLSRIVCGALLNHRHMLPSSGAAQVMLNDVTRLVVDELVRLTTLSEGHKQNRYSAFTDYIPFIEHYLLATVVGVYADDKHYFTFRCGDGEILTYRPGGFLDIHSAKFENNAPDYMGYGVLPRLNGKFNCPGSRYSLHVHNFGNVTEWTGTIIATDGAGDIVKERCYPGSERSVGFLEDLFHNEQLWANPDGLNRTLRLMNTDKTIAGKRYTGILADDTTVVMVKPVPVPVVPYLAQAKETGRWSSTNPPLANTGKTRETSDASGNSEPSSDPQGLAG